MHILLRVHRIRRHRREVHRRRKSRLAIKVEGDEAGVGPCKRHSEAVSTHGNFHRKTKRNKKNTIFAYNPLPLISVYLLSI